MVIYSLVQTDCLSKEMMIRVNHLDVTNWNGTIDVGNGVYAARDRSGGGGEKSIRNSNPFSPSWIFAAVVVCIVQDLATFPST